MGLFCTWGLKIRLGGIPRHVGGGGGGQGFVPHSRRVDQNKIKRPKERSKRDWDMLRGYANYSISIYQ